MSFNGKMYLFAFFYDLCMLVQAESLSNYKCVEILVQFYGFQSDYSVIFKYLIKKIFFLVYCRTIKRLKRRGEQEVGKAIKKSHEPFTDDQTHLGRH